MPFENFTPEQRRAVLERGRGVLVSAAAGSGKTAVLVERIIKLITEPSKPVDIDRLLVVTFTKSAADEMKRRIAASLAGMLEKTPDDANLHRQAALIQRARITTIHAFCSQVLRDYYFLTDVAPAFKVADESETELIKTEVMGALFEEEYGAEQNAAFLNLVDAYGGVKVGDDALRALVLRAHEFLAGFPWPQRAAARYAGADGPEAGPGIIKYVLACAREELEGALAGAESALAVCAFEGGPAEYAPALRYDRDFAARALSLAEPSYAGLHELFKTYVPGRLVPRRKGTDVRLAAAAKYAREAFVKGVLTDLKAGFFSRPPETVSDELRKTRPAAAELLYLAERFGDMFSAEKRRRNAVDFADLEHYAVRILLDETSEDGPVIPSPAALELRRAFFEIITDEYQDTNPLQELILNAVSHEGGANRFMVGDVKQSVYRFRRAEPAIFMRKYRAFSGGRFPDGGLRIDLSQNFRSRAAVLDAVNYIFSRLMKADFGGVDYSESSALRAGAVFPPAPRGMNVAGGAEIAILEGAAAYEPDQDEDAEGPPDTPEADGEADAAESADIESECAFIARRIKEFTAAENGLHVYDAGSGGYRLARFRDIAVLTRTGGAALAIADFLQKQGVPVYSESERNFFDALEVSVTLSLLQIIDNPLQERHLVTVLRSPIAMFNDNELLMIRRFDRGVQYFHALGGYAESGEDTSLRAKAAAFLKKLEKWREKAVFTPISALFDYLYAETGYYDCVGALTSGELRQANLRKLAEYGARYEKTSYTGLFHFVQYIQKLRKLDVREGEARAGAENADLVRVMTIHKSKGLEFPVVFVSALGRGFNNADARADVIFDRDFGLGMKYVDTDLRVKYPTLSHLAIARKAARESLEEELRVLYVAMTRAKEHLVLSGICKDFKNLAESARRAALFGGAVTVSRMSKAGSLLDYVRMAIEGHPGFARALGAADTPDMPESCGEGAPGSGFVFSIIPFNSSLNDIKRGIPAASPEPPPACPSEEFTDSPASVPSESPFAWRYPHAGLTRVHSKLSISEIKRFYHAELFGDSGQLQPAGVQPDIRAASSDASGQILPETSGGSAARPAFLSGRKSFTAAERGTILHTVMEHLDLGVHKTRADIESLLEWCLRSGVLTGEETAAVPVGKVLAFLGTPLAGRMRESPRVKKEAPFVIALPVSRLYAAAGPGAEGGEVLVHGIIDCFFEEAGGIVLVDYKTGHLSRDVSGAEDAKRRYGLQMSVYRRALEKSLGLRVSECVLYFFAANREVSFIPAEI